MLPTRAERTAKTLLPAFGISGSTCLATRAGPIALIRKLRAKMLRIKGAIGLLGLEGGIVEQSCRHQDEAQGSALNKPRGCGGNARFILKVDPSHPHASQTLVGSRARQRMNGFKPFGRKKVRDGGSDAAGCADDKGRAGRSRLFKRNEVEVDGGIAIPVLCGMCSGLDDLHPDGIANQIGQGVELQLPHRGGAMRLHRLDAEIQETRDLLVAFALGEGLHNLAFA